MNFPASPTLNQLWPDPALPGVPQWRWDGARWLDPGGAGGGEFLPLAGGTMQGPIYGRRIDAAEGVTTPALFSSESVTWNAISSPTVPGSFDYIEGNKTAVATNTALGLPTFNLQLAPLNAGAAGAPIAWTGTVSFGPDGTIASSGAVLAATTVHSGSGGFVYSTSPSFGWNWNSYSASFLVGGTMMGYWPTTDGSIGYMALSGGAGGPVNVHMNVFNGDRSVIYAIYADFLSDERIKKNVGDTEVDGLAAILATPIRQFDIKGEAIRALRPKPPPDAPVERATPIRDEHVPIGIVAQEVQSLMPEMVAVSTQPENHDPAIPSDFMSVNNAAAVPYLIRAVQQLAARVAELETAR